MNTKNPLHRSRKVAEILGKSIQDGQLPIGSRLPSCRALANQFGVSVNTVQLALRELETRNLLDRAHGRPSIVKSPDPAETKSPPRGGSLVGLITPVGSISARPTFSEDYWIATILRSAEQALFDTKLIMTTLPSLDEGQDFLPKLSARLDQYGQDLGGVLCFTQSAILPVLEQLDRRDIKWLTIGRPSPAARHNFVAADNQGACRLMGKTLAQAGYQRIWVICGQLARFPAYLDQVTGLHQGYLEAGADPSGIEVIPVSGFDEMTGYTAVKSRLQQGIAPPQAIFAGDQRARGACQALGEAGIRIPQDVSVISSGGDPAQTHNPPLTTIAQPAQRMGQEAGAMLGHMIREEHPRITGRWMDCELIFRQSLSVPDEVMHRTLEEQRMILTQS